VPRIDDLIDQIRVLEEEMQIEYAKKRYVAGASWLMGVTAPVIYLGIVSMLLLDAFLCIYQSICFPVYGIAKARRSDYMVLDRQDLPYLNALEKLNCG